MSVRFSLDPAFRDSDPSSDNDSYKRSMLNHGIALMKLERYEGALEVFNKAIELDRQFSEAWCKKGDVLIKLGRNDEALECFEKVVNLEYFSQSMHSINRRGTALMMLGKIDEALPCFIEVTRRDPKDSLGALKKLIKLYKKIVEFEPENVNAWNYLGFAFFKKLEFKESLNSYNKSLEIDPNSSICWFNKGFVLAKLGNNDDALQCYEEAIKLNSQYSKAWYNKGVIHAKLKAYDTAILAFDKAIEIDPHYDKAKYARNRTSLYMKGFTPIKDLEYGIQCSILGYIISLGEERDFLRSNGTFGKVADFYISDDTGKIRVVLWDDQVSLIDGLDLGYQVRVKDCIVRKDWNENLELGCNYRTKIAFSAQDSIDK